MHDIQHIDDVKVFVNHFYNTAKIDDVLGPIFTKHIPEESWQEHMDVIYQFWDSLLFDKMTYRANAFIKHIKLNIDASHFERWLLQFNVSIDLHFEGPVAEKAKARASSIAMLFQHKLEMLK